MIQRGAQRDNKSDDKRGILRERKDSRNNEQIPKKATNATNSRNQDYQRDSEGQQWIFIKVHLKKGRKGFGFAFIHDKSTRREEDTISITKIVHEGVAQQDGRLKIGDIIVSVNDVDFDEVTYETAISTLKNLGTNLTMTVRRLKEYFYESDEPDYINPIHSFPPLNTYESDDTFESDNETGFQQLEVSLTKREIGGLGINIEGGYDAENEDEEDNYIKISKLAVNGVAANDGQLQVGDIILQVDFQTFDGLTHYEAVEILKKTGKNVKIFIGRFVEKRNTRNLRQR